MRVKLPQLWSKQSRCFLFLLLVPALTSLFLIHSVSDSIGINNFVIKEQKKTKVFVLPNIPDEEAGGALKHFILDGINKSFLLERTLDMNDPDAIWVVDVHQSNDLFPCKLTASELWKRYQYDQSHQQKNATAVMSSSIPGGIYMIDFHDHYRQSKWNCLENIGKNNTIIGPKLYLALRSQVLGRKIATENMKEDELFHQLGRRVDNIQSNTHFQFLDCLRTIRYGVRGDIINSLERIVSTRQSNNATHKVDIVTMSRPSDVIHFWKPDSDDFGKLRTKVSNALIKLGKDPVYSHYIIDAKEVSERNEMGRSSVDDVYAEKLLEYKIIVVCQRDSWEDHYRLMEALAGGAMVMTDPMHPLPYQIEDGKQVIVYRSLAELKRLIIYYLENKEERLAIARSGHENAIKYHQSHTWMERLIFGDWKKEHGA